MGQRLPSLLVLETRRRVGAKVRELRTDRHWTQAELADRLGLSQGRLSELERGGGSFSAEQFLLILQLFNVGVEEFGESAVDSEPELHNAVARLGAFHIREHPDVQVPAQLRLAAEVVRAVLLHPSSERLVTSLAPVLVWSIDDVLLPALQDHLVRAGAPNRLGWLVDNVLSAMAGLEAFANGSGAWPLRARRARTVLSAFLDHLRPARAEGDVLPDPFDRGIRSRETLDAVWAGASPISHRWRIASALAVEDFSQALREAHDLHP